MKKIDKIAAFINKNKWRNPDHLAYAVSMKFRVGIYIDLATASNYGRIPKSCHGFEIWFKRKNAWVKSAGWLHVSVNDFINA